MKWSDRADNAIKKVPFFIRKKVKGKVEKYVEQKGKKCVELSDVNELKKQFLSPGGMEKEIKGYEISTCFGSAGCANVANPCKDIAEDVEKIVVKADLFSFLKDNIKGELKFHHEFRISFSDCPNACSRPQIVDVGVIGAVSPGFTEESCLLCHACTEVCDENAVYLEDGADKPVIDYNKCMMCGKCIHVCPSGTLKEKEKGFRVLLGGRLGRHPRLAMEIKGIKTHDEVLEIVRKSIKFYKTNSKNGRRFADILVSSDQIIDMQD